MKPDVEITAERILRERSAIHLAMPTDAAIQTTSAAEIAGALRRRFETGPDAGVRKRLANAVFEPPNPFEAKSRRRMRQEVIILGTLTFAAIALATYFNLNAPPR